MDEYIEYIAKLSGFLRWLTIHVLDEEDWDENSDAYGELICRRLEKLGYIKYKRGYYEEDVDFQLTKKLLDKELLNKYCD